MELGKTKFEIGDQVFTLSKERKCEKVFIKRIWANVDTDGSISIEYGVIDANEVGRWEKEENLYTTAAQMQQSIFADI